MSNNIITEIEKFSYLALLTRRDGAVSLFRPPDKEGWGGLKPSIVFLTLADSF
jgi:hypothetical protein